MLYLSQLTSCDGSILLRWTDLNYRAHLNKCTREPRWFKLIKNIMLNSPSTSLRLLQQYRTDPRPLSSLNRPLKPNAQKCPWVAIWNNVINAAVIGRVVIKDRPNNAIVVEHFRHHIDNVASSPTYQKPIVFAYSGCECHSPHYSALQFRKKPYPYKCTAKYYAAGAVYFPKVTKCGDKYILPVSLFELQQQAEQIFTNNCIIRSTP